MRNTILIVDDVDINRDILNYLFCDEYSILEAADGEEALQSIEAHKDELVVILLDLIMPKKNGFEVLEVLSKTELLKIVPVILITENDTSDSQRRCYDLGAMDLISKPFDEYVAKKRVKNAIDLFMHKNELEVLVDKQTVKLKKQAKELKETNYRIIDALSTVVEFRNLESGNHVIRIKDFTKILLEYIRDYHKEYDIKDEDIEVISQAAAMHDVGKIAIPDEILLKPGRLTPEEFEIMKTHTTQGCAILKNVLFMSDTVYYNHCYDICNYHHERYDGKGYPCGLSEDDIPIAAQAVSIADVYDALVSERVYKKAFSKEEAYNMIMEGKCGTFNPKLLECFKMAKNRFEELADQFT